MFQKKVHLVITKQVDTLVVPSPDPLTCLLPLLGTYILNPLLKKPILALNFRGLTRVIYQMCTFHFCEENQDDHKTPENLQTYAVDEEVAYSLSYIIRQKVQTLAKQL